MAKFHQFYHAYNKDNRHYTYWQDDGSRATLTAGEDGVTEAWIAQLKAWHKEERSVMRHGEGKLISLDAMTELLSDHSAALVNHEDPEHLLLAELEQAERKAQLRTAFNCLTEANAD